MDKGKQGAAGRKTSTTVAPGQAKACRFDRHGVTVHMPAHPRGRRVTARAGRRLGVAGYEFAKTTTVTIAKLLGEHDPVGFDC